MLYIINFLILILVYLGHNFFKYIKQFPDLQTNSFFVFFHFLFILSSFSFFVIFFRFLNLFRSFAYINLVDSYSKIIQYGLMNIIFFLLGLTYIMRFFFFFFKFNFLKVHYYLLNSKNFYYNEYYISFIYFFVTWPNRFILYFLSMNINFFQVYRRKIYLFLKYIFHVLMLCLFIYDIIFNGYFLLLFSSFLPFYSFYQLLFKINDFFYFDLEYLYDTIISDVLYSDDYSKIFRLYHEYSEYKSIFSFNKPKGYSKETDEFLIIRNYITKKLFV